MQKKILLVDDEECIRTVYSDLLQEAGFQVTAIKSGKEAKQYLSESLPDLVIMDMKNEHMNGQDFIHELRQLSFDGPIVIFTGANVKSLPIVQAALDAGASLTVSKLTDPNDFVDIVCTMSGFHTHQRLKNIIFN